MSNRNTTDEDVTRGDDPATTRDEERYNPNPGERGKTLSAIIALLGLWMIIQAVLFDIVAAQFWNDVIVGLLLLAVGGYNYYRRGNEQIASVAAASIAALLGLWLIAAPFLFGAGAGAAETTNDMAFWNDVIVGLLALVLGAYSAYQARDQRSDARRAAA